LILIAPLLLPRFFAWTLSLPLTIRLGLTALVLSPLGLLMGVPFPAGIRLMKWEQAAGVAPSRRVDRQSHAEAPSRGPADEAQGGSIPWIWAVNGAASVIASILSALLALTFGFSWVLRLGALCYAGAWLMGRSDWHSDLRRRADHGVGSA
jgi:hypothetical protein